MCYIAEADNDYSSKNLRNSWEYVELFHKELDKNIVKQHAYRHQQKTPEQLYPPMKRGIVKNNIAHQKKAGRKAHDKSDDERHYVRTNGHGPDVHNLFVEDIVITDKKCDNIKQGISPAADNIPECLGRNIPPERNIKIIKKGGQQVCHAIISLLANLLISSRFCQLMVCYNILLESQQAKSPDTNVVVTRKDSVASSEHVGALTLRSMKGCYW